MNLPPVTVEEALEYIPRAMVLDLTVVAPSDIGAVVEHLHFAVASAKALMEKLIEAEQAIVEFSEANSELARLLSDAIPQLEVPQHGAIIDTKNGPLLVEPPKTMYDPDLDQWYTYNEQQHSWEAVMFPLEGPATVEFRTDGSTYEQNTPEIHRMLAQEIVREFGGQRQIPTESGDNEPM